MVSLPDMRNKLKVLIPLAVAATAAIMIPSIASGQPARTAAASTQLVTVAGALNDGYFLPASGPKLTYKINTKVLRWVWSVPDGGSQHDVRLDTAKSVKFSAAELRALHLTSVTSATKGAAAVFVSSPLIAVNFGDTYQWPKAPTQGWKAPKVGTYYFYCSKHKNTMNMTVKVTK